MFRRVLFRSGVEGFTADHLAGFKQHGIDRVLIAYDRDEAGNRAAEKPAKQLMAEGLDCYRIQFPKGMDVNEYALKVTPAARSLGLAIRKAQWLGRGEAKPIQTAVSVPPASTAAKNEPAAKEEIPTPGLHPAQGLHPAPTVRQESAAIPTLDTIPTPPCAAPLPGAVLPDAVPLAASPVPSPAAAEVDAQVRDEEIVIVLGDRRYRVRGLKKNLAFDVMLKVNVLIARGEGCTPQGAFHVDTLDLYSVRARGSFIAQAATELNVHEDVIRHDLGQVLRKLESLQERAIEQTLTLQDPVLAIPQEEAQTALTLLKDPTPLDRILADFTRCGVVGEETNRLIGYLAATSRKLEAPLAVMVTASRSHPEYPRIQQHDQNDQGLRTEFPVPDSELLDDKFRGGCERAGDRAGVRKEYSREALLRLKTNEKLASGSKASCTKWHGKTQDCPECHCWPIGSRNMTIRKMNLTISDDDDDVGYLVLPGHPEPATPGVVAKQVRLKDLVTCVGADIHLDFDKDGNLIGLEILV